MGLDWEAFAITRRTLLVAVFVFEETNPGAKYAWAAVLCLIFLLAHQQVRPFLVVSPVDEKPLQLKSTTSMESVPSLSRASSTLIARLKPAFDPNVLESVSLVILSLMTILRSGVLSEGSSMDKVAMGLLLWPFAAVLVIWLVATAWKVAESLVSRVRTRFFGRRGAKDDFKSQDDLLNHTLGLPEVEMQPNPLLNQDVSSFPAPVAAPPLSLPSFIGTSSTPLPADFIECQTEDGLPYYFSKTSGESVWERPSSS